MHYPALIACCAYFMRRFGAACIGFQRVNETAGWKPLQLIALFLSIPCFEISNLLFQLA